MGKRWNKDGKNMGKTWKGMKETKMEGVTEWHLPKTDESVVQPTGECSLRHIEMK